jgi:hypothetical protein
MVNIYYEQVFFFYLENIFRYDESLHIKYPELISDLELWADSYRCKWTDVSYKIKYLYSKYVSFNKKEVTQSRAAEYFVKFNEQYLSNINENNDNSKIITFSHFLTSK